MPNATLVKPFSSTSGFQQALATNREGTDSFILGLADAPITALIEGAGAGDKYPSLSDSTPFLLMDGNIGLYLQLLGIGEDQEVACNVIGVMQYHFPNDQKRFDLELIGTLTGTVGEKKTQTGGTLAFCDALDFVPTAFGEALMQVYQGQPEASAGTNYTIYEGTEGSATLFIPNLANIYGIVLDFDMSISNVADAVNAMWSKNV